ncbi:hypothetical protein ACFOKF_23320 [Sphingobium rhizovicinum]|uniref:Uncharacterized protein n=1 Tax=Sphingobium rhizovicinum TaxID=432308 RepID=A0ABV7NNS5_9SPHN
MQWNGSKLKSKAIDDLVSFLASEEGEAIVKDQQASGVPMEADDLGFWEYHLDL